MAADTNLVLLRDSLAVSLGMDLVDSRNGIVLAWAPNYTAIPLAERLNLAYPDRDLAPDSDTLMHELPSYMGGEGGADDH